MSFNRFVTFSIENNIFTRDKFLVNSFTYLDIRKQCSDRWSHKNIGKFGD